MPKKSKAPKKHPKDMTTDEAIQHLFHPKVVKRAKEHAHGSQPRKKKGA
jgi:hypothetical protein